MKIATLALKDVLTYTNLGVVERITKEAKVTAEEAREIFLDTLRFLYLAARTKENLVPTKRIDLGWHAFILFTKDYARFCHGYLGRFIHHCPTTSKSKPLSAEMHVRTFELAKQTFGPNLSANWGYNVSAAAECDKSGCNCSPDSGGGGDECTPD